MNQKREFVWGTGRAGSVTANEKKEIVIDCGKPGIPINRKERKVRTVRFFKKPQSRRRDYSMKRGPQGTAE